MLLFAEEVWFLSTWWLWFGTGTIPNLASEQATYQRCLSVPTVYRKMSAMKFCTLGNLKNNKLSQLKCGI